jgi:hypothetical protein
VVYVGQNQPAPATQKYHRRAEEGVPVCDLPPPAVSRPVEAARPAPVGRAADSVSALSAITPAVQLKVALRNLEHSQEAWFGTQGYYSRTIEPFALQYLWPRGVRLRILSAGVDSWSAKATHTTWPGKSCVIWFGRVPFRPATDAEKRTADRSGVPVCDE